MILLSFNPIVGETLIGKHTVFGVQASTLKVENLNSLKQPSPEKDGKIKTLNAMGYMTPEVDHITQDFIEFAANTPLPVLDGGAAYGVASIPALKKGATVIANDIDPNHLVLIAQNKTLTSEEKERLYLNEDMLPNKANFPDHSLGAILLCRVAHFFTPEEMQAMFEKAKRWLSANGRLYIVTMTPYHYTLEGFANIYERRWQEAQAWPGVITTMTKNYGIEHTGNIPKYLHVMDPRLMTRLASEYGFLIKKIELFGHHRNPKENGLGYIGAILIKQETKP